MSTPLIRTPALWPGRTQTGRPALKVARTRRVWRRLRRVRVVERGDLIANWADSWVVQWRSDDEAFVHVYASVGEVTDDGWQAVERGQPYVPVGAWRTYALCGQCRTVADTWVIELGQRPADTVWTYYPCGHTVVAPPVNVLSVPRGTSTIEVRDRLLAADRLLGGRDAPDRPQAPLPFRAP